ncbi:MAG: hypothetical protein ACYS8W_14845 [Planctomycetota bacterium]|jgi:hypothetical protein
MPDKEHRQMNQGMNELAKQDAPEIWEKYSSVFSRHLDACNHDGQYNTFIKFLEEMKFLFPSVPVDELLDITTEASGVDLKIPARRRAISFWGKYLLEFSKHERKGSAADMFRVFRKFVRDLKECYHPDIPEEDLIEIAEDVMGKPDFSSPEGCMAELLVNDDEYIGVLEAQPEKPDEDSEEEDSESLDLDIEKPEEEEKS